MANFHVIIPAAGSGSRMQSGVPKQYLPLSGKPIIQHTLAVFAENSRINSITIVLSPDDAIWDGAIGLYSIDKLHIQRRGGVTRADTVLNGLESLEQAQPDDWILVHDAARPGLSAATLDRLLDTLENDEVGGLLAIPLADTLKRANTDQRVAATEPRDALWQAQTPQMFRHGLLQRALQHAHDTAPTDEAQAIERLGFKPKLVLGELRNLKITYPQDLALVQAIISLDNSEKKDGN